jgi:hypothetical protein
MDQGVLSFKQANPSTDFINSIFSFDVRKLETTDTVMISQFIVALSQYSIYFKFQQNQTKVEILKKKRFIDSTVTMLITKDVLKTYKTKKDATCYIINTTEDLSIAEKEIEVFQDELTLLDGIDKTISELIAAFKREMTRRENELWQTRKER